MPAHRWLLALLSAITLPLAAPLQAASSAVVETEQVRAQLLSETTGYVPGQPLLLALRLQPQPHWHTYWRNPGDSGLETRIEWQLPAGVTASPIRWPVPQKFDADGMVSFGYEGDTWLLTSITPPASMSGPLTFSAHAKWLACREACIPGEGKFTLTLPRMTTATRSEHTAGFASARERLPKSVDWPARYSVIDNTLQIELTAPADALPGQPELFVAQQQLVDHTKPIALQRDGDTLLITQPLSPYFRKPPATLDVVLSTGERAYAVRATAIRWQ